MQTEVLLLVVLTGVNMSNNFKILSDYLYDCKKREKNLLVMFVLKNLGSSAIFLDKNEYDIFHSFDNKGIGILQNEINIFIKFDSTSEIKQTTNEETGTTLITINLKNSEDYILIREDD